MLFLILTPPKRFISVQTVKFQVHFPFSLSIAQIRFPNAEGKFSFIELSFFIRYKFHVETCWL